MKCLYIIIGLLVSFFIYAEKWGLTVAKQYLPPPIVAWMMTQLLPEDIACVCDTILRKESLQYSFKRLFEETNEKIWDIHKKKLELLGCVFLKASCKGPSIIFKHKKIPHFVFKCARKPRSYRPVPTTPLGRSFFLTIGRVWFRNFLHDLVKEYNLEHHIQLPQKWIYCLKDPSTCLHMALMTVAEEVNCSHSDQIIPEQEAALNILKHKGHFTDWHISPAHNIICHGDKLILFDTEPHHTTLDRFLESIYQHYC